MLLKELLLQAVIIAVCEAQYGEVAPPAPVPPPDYVPYAPLEVPSSTKTTQLETENDKTLNQEYLPQLSTASYEKLPQAPGNVSIRLPEEVQGPPREQSVQPPPAVLGPPQGIPAPSPTTLYAPQVPPSAEIGLIPGTSQPQQPKAPESTPAVPQPQPEVPQPISAQKPHEPQRISASTKQLSTVQPVPVPTLPPSRPQPIPSTSQRPSRLQPVSVPPQQPSKPQSIPATPQSFFGPQPIPVPPQQPAKPQPVPVTPQRSSRPQPVPVPPQQPPKPQPISVPLQQPSSPQSVLTTPQRSSRPRPVPVPSQQPSGPQLVSVTPHRPFRPQAVPATSLKPSKPQQPTSVSSQQPVRPKPIPVAPPQPSRPEPLSQTARRPTPARVLHPASRQPVTPLRTRMPTPSLTVKPSLATPSAPRQKPQIPVGTPIRNTTGGTRRIRPSSTPQPSLVPSAPLRRPETILPRQPETAPRLGQTVIATRQAISTASTATTTQPNRATSRAIQRPPEVGPRQPSGIVVGQPPRPQTIQPLDNTLGEVPQAVRLPPHTPITAPAQPDREGARGFEAARIPPGAELNRIAPPVEVKPPEKFRYNDCITDTLFVVDSTSSVRRFFDDHRAYLLAAIELLLPDGDDDTRIGKLPFFAGITATGAALNLTLEALQKRRLDVNTNVVVITDGFSYDLVDGPAAVLHQMPNVRTFTATVTDSWRQYELETIAGDLNRIFKGMDSVRNLVNALTSCNDGPRRSNIRNRTQAKK